MINFSFITDLLTKSINEATVTVDNARCLRTRLSTCSCDLCVNSCPNKALHLEDRRLSLDEEKCSGCMLCTTVCPNDALLSGVDLKNLITGLPDSDTITITCKRQRSYRKSEAVLPCLATLPAEALILLGFSRNSTRFIFTAVDCNLCKNNSSFRIFAQTLDHISHEFEGLISDSFQLVTRNDDLATDRTTRRTFLKSISKSIKNKAQFEPRTYTDDSHHATRRSITTRRMLADEAGSHVPPEHRVLFSELTANKLIIQENCIPCNRCSGICPSGALKIRKSEEKKELAFDSVKCSGCGLCTDFCKKTALSLSLCPLSKIALKHTLPSC